MATAKKQVIPTKRPHKGPGKRVIKLARRIRSNDFTPHGRKLFHFVPEPSDHPIFSVAKPYVGGVPVNLPNDVDMRPICLPVRSDFIDGPCAGFATAAFRELTWSIANNGQLPPAYLSPAFLYAYARLKEGTFPNIAFTSVGDELYSLQSYGVCPEPLMPYDPNNLGVPPSAAAMNAALSFRISSPVSINFSAAANIQSALADKHPIVVGFTIFPSFLQTGSDGWIPMRSPGEQPGGGHAMLICGYHVDPNDATQNCWIARSEDTTFGDHGYGYMPFGFEQTWIQAFSA